MNKHDIIIMKLDKILVSLNRIESKVDHERTMSNTDFNFIKNMLTMQTSPKVKQPYFK